MTRQIYGGSVAPRETWHGHVYDKPRFVKAIAANLAFLHLLAIERLARDRYAKSLKSVDLGIDGVRGVCDRGIAKGRK